MNFDFSDDLKLLRREAQEFLADRCPPEAVRKVIDSGPPYDKELWQQVAALGWTGAAIPEAYGGAGMGHLALCVLAEQLGAALAPIPFSSSIYLAAEAIALGGSETQKREWLPGLASGKIIGTLAVAEPGRAGLRRLRTTLRGGRLYGEKCPVPDGRIADMAVVAARGEDGLVLAIVDYAAKGIGVASIESLDPSRNQAMLTLDGVACEVLGTAIGGEALLREVENRAAILFAFEQVGGAQRCLEMACDYALERYAFGRPIGSFQAIKHKLAEVYVATELARSNAYYGAWALSKVAPQLPLAAATARVSANEAFWLAAKENIQVHGGMGFSWAFDCHLYYRRAKLLATINGSSRLWKDRLVTELESQNAPA